MLAGRPIAVAVGQLAEVERDLIFERTREGLAKARAPGRKLGRPKGSLGVSRLDGKDDDIRRFLAYPSRVATPAS